MEIRAERRADPPLPQAHGRQALQVPQLRSLLLAIRPPGAAHEAPHVRRDLSGESPECQEFSGNCVPSRNDEKLA